MSLNVIVLMGIANVMCFFYLKHRKIFIFIPALQYLRVFPWPVKLLASKSLNCDCEKFSGLEVTILCNRNERCREMRFWRKKDKVWLVRKKEAAGLVGGSGIYWIQSAQMECRFLERSFKIVVLVAQPPHNILLLYGKLLQYIYRLPL